MQISLMNAYIIEELKLHGVTYKEAEKIIKSGDLSDFNKYRKFDYNLLALLYHENTETVERAFEGKYQVSFLTINGLKNLLKLKFNIQIEEYNEIENGLVKIEASEDLEQKINEFISSNWKITRSGNQISILI